MATFQTVPRTEWQTFFDSLSSVLLGKWAEIEVASLALGDQIVAEWVPLVGITYDARDDSLDVALDRASHVIGHPREITVDFEPSGLASVAVVDADGERQVIRFKEPLKLPASGAQVHHS
jgi:hypothetical protein